jgi:predicted metal-dependent peptidase
MKTAEQLMTQARIRLIDKHPFFGNTAMKLKLIEDSSISTMCTDGKVIKYNAEFVEENIMAHNVGVLAHEVMHVTNGHPLRRGKKDHKLFNVACDYAINPILVDGGFVLPDGALLDLAYHGMSAEEIYSLLLDEYEQDEGDSGGDGEGEGETSDDTGDGDGDGDGNGDGDSGESGKSGDSGESGDSLADWVQDKFGDQAGEFEDQKNADGSDLSESEVREQLEDLTVSNAQSEMRSKSQGKGGSGFGSELKGATASAVAWDDVLLPLCQDALSDEQTYNRPNRRFIAEDMYMPSYDKSDIRCAVIGRDSSGSVCDNGLRMFNGGCQRIFEEVGFDKIYVVDFTDTVERVTEYDRGDTFDMEDRFYGGTHFASVTDWIEEEGINPSMLIYMTDGLGRAPLEPDYPVVWCLPENCIDDYTLRYSGIDQYGTLIPMITA